MRAAAPSLRPELRIIRTEGDRSQDRNVSLSTGSSVGVFVREIEEELLSHRIDLAVHSLKDLPTAQPAGLVVAAIPIREDPRDVLVLREGESLSDLPPGARVGTGSPRRIGQILRLRGDLRFEGVRGNVDTRLRKLREGRIDALVLALAGLNRIGASGARFVPFSLEQVLPAPGQGALGIEIRDSDAELARAVARALDHPPSAAAARAERAFLKGLGGGCQMPVGALATVEGPALHLEGAVAARDGSRLLRDGIRGEASRPEAAGEELARRLMEAGAARLLEEGPAGGERS